jgi:hypothetical protein
MIHRHLDIREGDWSVAVVESMWCANFKFYKRITDDKDFGKFFLDWLFDRFRNALGSQQGVKEESSRQPT